MSQKKWYKKKRYWLLLILIVFFFAVRMEWAKMRYDREVLLEMLQENGQSLSSFKSREVKGKSIHFLEVGNRKDLPIVAMVHGSPGALNAYEVYFTDSIMNTKVNMIAIDRPGFGYSDFGRSEPSLAVQAELIAAILKDYPDQKKILVGHSMGGPVISKLAMDYPDLVDGMVMVAPSISPDLEPSNTLRKGLDFPLFRWFTPAALRVCNQEIIPLRDELDLMMSDWEDVMTPVTVVQGEDDSLVPKGNADFAKAMMTENPNVKTTMIKGGNHFILWSEISLIKKEIFEVLKKANQ